LADSITTGAELAALAAVGAASTAAGAGSCVLQLAKIKPAPTILVPRKKSRRESLRTEVVVVQSFLPFMVNFSPYDYYLFAKAWQLPVHEVRYRCDFYSNRQFYLGLL
jgi:hypothetical protein